MKNSIKIEKNLQIYKMKRKSEIFPSGSIQGEAPNMYAGFDIAILSHFSLIP
jgi:hypothetical protein